jgi:hypothetical protein
MKINLKYVIGRLKGTIPAPSPFDKWMTRNFIMVFILPLFSYDKWQFLIVVFSYLNYMRLTNQQSKWEKENDNKCIRCGKV